ESDDSTAVVQKVSSSRKNEAEANERDVNRHEIDLLRQLFEVANIGPFDNRDTRIGPQPARQLPVANIDRVNPRGATLQQTIGEPARARTKVGRNEVAHLDTKHGQRMVELLAAAAHEPRRRF
ncbi:MAG: hypothetical protein K0S83_25, partial [Thermomicrobiales bacterium]|nr:hypothetical protein [Thermomicrobiales bacterium]